VEPGRGIPRFKDVYVSNVRVKYAKKAFNASGYEKSILRNFNFSKVKVFAADAGEINYAAEWKMDEVVVETKNNNAVVIKNATGVKL
jgi:hypothetical protein